ncbi:hypothetical protein GA0111570_102457 [Raineyella antarctica]|uniref:YdbS-like PH domain-containing protein n=1 Tax=Raineyella antarctica TaxID=1577474 RepID=A0A1G6GHK9_9ACTN|nr:PH domain-containing protein [Raineyella antarctica]SDB80666.1 hypothetical protein GA0111570_102457 [Raineyella antarctica]
MSPRPDTGRTSDILFAGPDVEWRPISPRWRTVHWLASGITALVAVVVLGVSVQLVFGRWELTLVPIALVAALWLWNAWLVLRRWPAWGYAETADELWVRHGVLFRSLTVVPYGRLQVVDVNAGPLQRAFGLAAVTLVTASADSDAHIPGLPYAEATRLRDQLTARGDSQGSGL